MPQTSSYDLKPVHTPRLRGAALRLVAALLERPAIRSLIAPWLMADLGLRELHVATINEPPTFVPLHGRSEAVTPSCSSAAAPHQIPRTAGFGFRGILDYQAAYLKGAVTPEQVAQRALEAIAASDRAPQPLGAVIACRDDDVMAQAHEATRRHKAGRPLGLMDGVPIGIKDELDMVPYPTTAGPGFLATVRPKSIPRSWRG